MLTDRQSQHIKKVLGGVDREHGIDILTTRVPRDELQQLHDLPDGYCKDLNLAPQYAKEYPCNTRELVQNWADRCKELSSTQAIQLQPLARHPQQEAAELGITALHVIIEKVTPQAGAGDAGGGGNRGRGSGANGKPAVLGLAVEYKDADGRRCVDLVNYTTVLSPDMFSLGASGKNKRAYAAGHFGEGMKVQINRLIGEWKAVVTFITGPCRWSFLHMAGPNCQQPTLHMFSTRDGARHPYPVPGNRRAMETVLTVAGIPQRAPGLDQGRYLFLQPGLRTTAVAAAQVPGAVRTYLDAQPVLAAMGNWFEMVEVKHGRYTLEFLFHPQLHNKLFLHGIYLKDICDPQRGPTDGVVSFGLNYVGPTEDLGALGLNRDRTNIQVPHLLQATVPRALHAMKTASPGPGLECVVRHLYDGFARDVPELHHLAYCPSSADEAQRQGFKTMANLLNQLLWSAYGTTRAAAPHLFPCDKNATEAAMAELTLLGLQPVKVSNHLMGIWTRAGELKTLDQLWQERRQQVDAMPDQLASLGGPEQQQQGEQLLSMLAGVLAPLGPEVGLPATPQGLRGAMKVLGLLSSSCYHNRVVIPFKPNAAAGQGVLLVVEAEYLRSLPAVHQRLRREGEPCPAQEQCRGTCIGQLLLQEAMEGLRKLGVNPARLSKCLARQCVTFAAPKVTLLGQQQPVAPPPPAGPQFHAGVQPYGVPGAAAGAAAGAGRGVGAAGAYGWDHQHPGHAEGACGHQHHQHQQQHHHQGGGVGHGPCANFNQADIAAALQRTAVHAVHPPPQRLQAQPEQQQQEAEVVTTCHLNRTLVVSRVHLEGGAGALYIPEGFPNFEAVRPMAAALGRSLSKELSRLFDEVFEPGRGHTLGMPLQYHVFWDPDTRVIAFNSNGRLWFNAAAGPASAGADVGAGRARFWFLTVCHELAHNVVGPHHSEFSGSMAALVLHFSHHFRAFMARRFGA